MPDFLLQLKKIRAQLFKWRLLQVLTGAILLWAGTNGVFALIERIHPWRETSIAMLLLLVFVLIALAVCWYGVKAWRGRPSYRALGRAVEAQQPELMDVLNCAVELAVKPAEQLSAFERLVLRRAEEQAREKSFADSIRTNPRAKLLAGCALCAGLLITGVSQFWPPMVKASFAFADYLRGEHSGLQVRPGNLSVPVGSDVSILATVLRGERRAEVILRENGETSRLQMRGNGGEHELQLYHLTQSVQYRVQTPSLDSPWYALEVFDPPQLKRAHWKVVPPGYTKLETFEQDGLTALKIPEGSRIDAEFWIAPNDAQALLIGESQQLSAKGEQSIRRTSWTPRSSGKFRLELTDRAGHRTQTDEFEIGLTLDEPPLVEWLQPARDVEATTAGGLALSALATDDYGVSQALLKYAYSGEQHELPVFMAPVEAKKTIEHKLSLAELPVKPGDVISYYLEVADNKEPAVQWSRSEIYFIEVVAERAKQEKQPAPADAAAGADAKKKELPIRALIAETKRLIRATYETEALRGKEREEQAMTLLADALALRKQLATIHEENRGAFRPIEGIDPGELLLNATNELNQAEFEIQQRRFFPGIDRQMAALRDLVQLYQLLKKESEQTAQASGKGENSESPNPQEGEQSAQTSQNDPSRQLSEMLKALEQVEGLNQRQKELNAEMNRAGKQQGGPAQGAKMAAQQNALRNETQELRDGLYRDTGKVGDVRGLELAAGEMEQAQSQLAPPDFSAAEAHGLRAAEALELSAEELRNQARQLAAELTKHLENRSRGLEQLQTQLRGAAQNAQGEKFDELRESQGQLNAQVNSLLAGIDRAAFALEKFQDQAAEELKNSGIEARRQGMADAGKRAQNALLYEAKDQAAGEQQKIEEGLQRLANRLQGVREQLSGGEKGALAELLGKILGARRGLGQMDQQQLQQTAKELAQELGGMSAARGNTKLDYLTHRLQNWGEGGMSVLGPADLDWMLGDTVNILKGMLWEQVVDDTIRKGRGEQQPPAKYKKQVEEYYRRIAEEL